MMDQEMLNRLWELLGHAEQVFPSRRERIATAAMQGMLAYHSTGAVGLRREHASAAVELADALIAELDKKP